MNEITTIIICPKKPRQTNCGLTQQKIPKKQIIFDYFYTLKL